MVEENNVRKIVDLILIAITSLFCGS